MGEPMRCALAYASRRAGRFFRDGLIIIAIVSVLQLLGD